MSVIKAKLAEWNLVVRVVDISENDQEHRQQLAKTGFWGKQGAGCIIMAEDTGRICLPHRSQYVEQPGTWGTWGGAIDQGEDPKAAAARELREEAGYHGPLRMTPLYVFKHSSGFTYYNFLAVVKTEFEPQLDWETQGYKWVEFGQWPNPLHSGLKILLNDAQSVEIIRRNKPKHPQQGQHYPSIRTIGYESLRDQNLEEKDEMPQASRPAIHKKQTIPTTTGSGDPMFKLLHTYTGNGANIWNNVLHRHYRKQSHGRSHYNKISQVDQYLQKFPLKQNLKVYTGIPESPSRVWEKYQADVTKPVRVHLPAYTSTTTNYTIAYVNFAREDRISPQDHPARNINSVSFPVYKGMHILHITVPKGYPALSLVDVSRYGDEEEEILLPRGLDIEIDPRPYIKPTPGQPGIIWFAKVVGHNPVVLG